MARIALNDRKVGSLKVTGSRPRQDYWDSVVPGLAVRCTNKGAKTFVLAARFAGKEGSYTRREIGKVGAVSLSDARKKARRWLEIISTHKDPAHEEAAIARTAAKKLKNTFESVAEAYISEWVIGPKPHKPRQRKHVVVARTIREHFVTKWGERPIADIERGEVVDLIKLKAKTAPSEARNWLGVVKTLLSWALDQNYGLTHSVCNDIKPGRIVGEKIARERALDDDELKAVWVAASELGYPVGTAYQMLILSGLRLNEVARASWGEINLPKRQWVIPPSA